MRKLRPSGVESSFISFVSFGLMMFGAAQHVSAQGNVFAYPKGGQNQEQKARDNFECHQWAVNQTGFDPTRPAPQAPTAQMAPPPPTRRGGMVRGAAGGAALGAVGGAIAGDAGEGAAIGAATGALFGVMRRRSQRVEQQQWQQQQQMQMQQAQQMQAQQNAQAMQTYERAFGACMTARNYQVQ